MNKYTLIGKYTLAEGQTKDTCEHCGRAIKSVYIVRNNLTGENMKIGSTCIVKIMNLNEAFGKALTKTIKNYDKRYNEYLNSLDITSRYNQILEMRLTQGLENTKELRNDIMYFVIGMIGTNLYYLIKETEKFNKLSKTGLIELANLEELKEQEKEYHNRFQTREKGNSWEYILDNEKEILNIIEG